MRRRIALAAAVLATSAVGAALVLCGGTHGPATAGPCVATDPIVVLGQAILPAQTVCVPPQ